MQVYLPIAEMPVDPFVVLAMGGAVGFLSGMFGVGGGFLITPLLIFYGIPPAIAVGTQGAQLVASSVSGLTAHLKRKTVDLKMGTVLLIGGLIGAAIGVHDYERAAGLFCVGALGPAREVGAPARRRVVAAERRLSVVGVEPAREAPPVRPSQPPELGVIA